MTSSSVLFAFYYSSSTTSFTIYHQKTTQHVRATKAWWCGQQTILLWGFVFFSSSTLIGWACFFLVFLLLGPTCSNGLPGVERASICCVAECGTCGGKGCQDREGGADACCTNAIRESGDVCSETNSAPCFIDSSEYVYDVFLLLLLFFCMLLMLLLLFSTVNNVCVYDDDVVCVCVCDLFAEEQESAQHSRTTVSRSCTSFFLIFVVAVVIMFLECILFYSPVKAYFEKNTEKISLST